MGGEEVEILADIRDKLDAINNSIWGANDKTKEANDKLHKELLAEIKELRKNMQK